MFALTSTATTPTALAVSPALIAPPAADRVSTRVTPAALAAPLPENHVANDSRGSPAIAVAAETPDVAAPTASSGPALGAPQQGAGPSVLFLAQLIGQNGLSEDIRVADASAYAGFAPAPTYATFVSYGIVKYRPSDAGLSSAYSPVGAAVKNDDASSASRFYGATQSRNRSHLADEGHRLQIAG